jgi:hypothetical protein
MKKYEIYTLDDNKDYLVVDTFEMDGNNYVYLVEADSHSNVICGKLVDNRLDVILDEEELEKFLKKVSEDL